MFFNNNSIAGSIPLIFINKIKGLYLLVGFILVVLGASALFWCAYCFLYVKKFKRFFSSYIDFNKVIISKLTLIFVLLTIKYSPTPIHNSSSVLVLEEVSGLKKLAL